MACFISFETRGGNLSAFPDAKEECFDELYFRCPGGSAAGLLGGVGDVSLGVKLFYGTKVICSNEDLEMLYGYCTKYVFYCIYFHSASKVTTNRILQQTNRPHTAIPIFMYFCKLFAAKLGSSQRTSTMLLFMLRYEL